MASIHPDIDSVLISREEIADAVSNIGKRISADYAGREPIIVCVLKGSLPFCADLMRGLDIHCVIDFMKVSSYGAGTKSTGNVKILQDLTEDISGRDILICEDIIDSGLTLSCLKNLLLERGAASVAIVSFCVKDIDGYECPVKADYVCFHVPNKFVVGYGLDYAERYRNLPYVGVLKHEVYE